jgi:hypothetical protein
MPLSESVGPASYCLIGLPLLPSPHRRTPFWLRVHQQTATEAAVCLFFRIVLRQQISDGGYDKPLLGPLQPAVDLGIRQVQFRWSNQAIEMRVGRRNAMRTGSSQQHIRQLDEGR